ncbi:MAG TPA: hypothetical protein VL651_02885 [Bacteroidia bacterium]|jgi:hypothetical protein|nr:hypothetical protein [Bacteroidia bacterium]
MKKLLFLLIAFQMVRCSEPAATTEVVTNNDSLSTAIETQALACWSKNWSTQKDFDISKGINLADDYLFAHGYLGKRYVDDYRRFFTGTNVIYIPDSVPGSADMIASLNSDFSGAPDIEGMQSCWKSCWFDKMTTLDSTDVMRRIGKMVEKLAQSGPPDIAKASDEFFNGLSQEELNRPFIKDIAYFIFWKTSYGQTHIVFKQPEVNSNAGVDPAPNNSGTH